MSSDWRPSNDEIMLGECSIERENSIDILPDSISSYNAEDTNQFETVVVFDCRGVEPVDFYPRVRAEGEETGTPYPEVSLTEGEWVDYDEKKGESVGIYEIEQKFPFSAMERYRAIMALLYYNLCQMDYPEEVLNL
ncbi:hypothetical protein DPMN_147259 [Dreissena polymorpha]|uniref:Uncharacterized protein n=1 Tax=Dreissena polymorpha TaxID=45954 RepID=A0A9D4FBW4_DREPO|nr:hypothetical protein DPMN_147259 [Dreissena polymorpha]